jgi:superfamily II DNA or RNA helicase
MPKTILSKDGYLIYKKKIDKLQLINIKNELTVEPHVFNVNYGQKKEDTSFTVYRETDEYLSVPKYYGIEKMGKPDINNEISGESIDINFTGSLRDEQIEIINNVLPKIVNNDGGLICIGCGKGKTVLGLNIAVQLKVKTLIIVHKTFLMNQWIERIKQFTNAKVGIIQQKKIQIEGNQIVIGMLQSIAKEKYDPDIFRDFGLVIFDEAHHAPSKYFSRSLPLINCKKTLALSATPKRNDKLEKVLHWYFGPIIYKSDDEINTNVLTKIYKYNLIHEKYYEKKQKFTGEVNRAGTISNIVTIGRRNKFIVDIIENILIDNNRKILVLSERINHLELLKNRLDEREITTTGSYIGGMKQIKLDESAKCQVIFGTYHMASEALDIKGLNTLIMASPRREIEQAVGRITRDPNTTVQPLVIDIIDGLNSFENQSFFRRKYYQKNEFQIMFYEVVENKIISEKNISKCPIKVETVIEFID